MAVIAPNGPRESAIVFLIRGPLSTRPPEIGPLGATGASCLYRSKTGHLAVRLGAFPFRMAASDCEDRNTATPETLSGSAAALLGRGAVHPG